MPQYEVNIPGQGVFTVDSPQDLTDEQAYAAVRRQLRAEVSAPVPAPAPQPIPSPQRTGMQAVTDIGAGIVGGLGSVLQVPGQLTKLVPGLYDVGTAIEAPGEYLSKLGQSFKSEGLKVREAMRSKAISEAEKDGVLAEFVTAIKETIKDPALFSTFMAEQIPQLIGPLGAAKIAKAGLGAKAAAATAGLEGEAAATALKPVVEAAQQRATRAAIGTGAVMQGADISDETYKAALEAAKQRNPNISDEEAHAQAINAARLAGVGAGGISLLAQKLPGAREVEKRLAGAPGGGRLAGFFGEAASEMAEEGGGAFTKNLAIQQLVNPEQSLTAGVGAAAGLGAIGGGVMGGFLSHAKPKPEETDRQRAERLLQEINDLQSRAAEQQQPLALTYGSSDPYIVFPDGSAGRASEVENYIKSLPEDQQVGARAKLFGKGDVLFPSMTYGVITDEDVKNLGIRNGSAKDSLVGLNIFSDQDSVRKTLESAKKDAPKPVQENIDNFLLNLGTLQGKALPPVEEAPKLPTADDIIGMASQPNGWVNLELLKQNILTLPQNKETRGAVKTISEIQGRITTESIQRQAPSAPTVVDDNVIKKLGFVKSDKPQSLYQQLIGKDLTKPEDFAAVTDVLTKHKAKTTETVAQRIDTFLQGIQKIPTLEVPSVGEAVTEPSGASAAVAGEPSAGAPAAGARVAEPSGVAPTEPLSKPVETRAPEQPAPVAPTLEAAPKTARDAVEQHAVQGMPIVEAPLDQVTLSTDVPQFKSEANKQGIVKPLEGKFERVGVAPIQIWQRNDGRLEVISGRHRFDLAKRSGEATIPAQIHKESEGFDAIKAATLDAELNIRDEQGDVKDYVVYFEKSGITEPEAKSRGLLGRTVGQRGWSIASQGSPDLIAAHRAGQITDEAAAGVAAAAPNDARLQAVGIRGAQQDKSARAIVNTVLAVKTLSEGKPQATEDGDLFGFDESAMREAEDMARVATSKQKEIAARLSAITGAASKPEIAKKEGIDIRDPKALEKRIAELKARRAAWDNWSSSPELVNEIKQELAGPTATAETTTATAEPVKEEATKERVPTERQQRIAFGKPKKEAKPTLREATAPEKIKLNKEIEAKIDELGKVLKRMLGKMGLDNVALNIVNDLKNSNGEYANRLITLALNAESPVRDLRHESIHALKEMGFFSEKQWATLEKMAREKWVDQYLKSRMATVDGKEMSRYDAYMQLYGNNEATVLEEAIADAFGDFDLKKPPPGMLAALTARMKQFFRELGSAMGMTGLESAEDIFRKVEKGELKAKEAASAAEVAKPSLRTTTPEFKQWFGKSKIVDADGKPKVMYHGTAKEYGVMGTARRQAKAIFLTDDPKFAEKFSKDTFARAAANAEDILTPEQIKRGKADAIAAIRKDYGSRPEGKEMIEGVKQGYREANAEGQEYLRNAYRNYLPSGPNIMPLYVKAENPFDYDNPEHIDALKKYDEEHRYTPRSLVYHIGAVRAGNWEAIEEKPVQNAIKALGFDSFYVKEHGKKSLAVYSSDQLKSATGNVGAYGQRPVTAEEAKRLGMTEAEAKEAQARGDIRLSLREGAKQNLRSTTDRDILERIEATTTARQEKTFVQRILDSITPKSAAHFRAAALNRYHYLSEIDKKKVKLMGGARLLASASAEQAALNSDLASGLMASAFGVHDRKGGAPVYVRHFIVEVDHKQVGPKYDTRTKAEAAAQASGGVVRERGHTVISNFDGKVKGPLAIFAPLAKYGDPFIYQKYQFWAGVKRGSRFMEVPQPDGSVKVLEKNFEKDDIKRAEQILKEHPEFESIQKEWITYNNELVKFLMDTGVLSKAGAEEMMKHGDYIPFYRQLEEEGEAIGPKIFQSIGTVKAPKKLKHGEGMLGDFLENVVRNSHAAIHAGIKNIAASRARDIGMDVGEVIPAPKGLTQKFNQFTVMENGVPVAYSTADQLFTDAVKSLHLPDMPFIGLLSAPANVLRNFVTKDPAFILANMMRDSMQAWTTSGLDMKPMISTFKNFGTAIAGKDPVYEKLLNAGILGGQEYAEGVRPSARKFGRQLRKEAGALTPAELAARPAMFLWETLEKGTMASDAATRMEVFKKTLEETGDEAEALAKALEVMNFNRKGSSAVVRILTAAVPFLNARMQGLDVLYRAAIAPTVGEKIYGIEPSEAQKKIQKTFMIRGLTIMALSCMYWAVTHDDDEYKRQEQETRDNYWLIPSMGVKIPIPFEVGVMFKVIPERIMEYAFGSDTGKDFIKSMGRNLWGTLGFQPIPQAALPIVETMANYSFFTGRSIVGQGMEEVAPEFQVGPGTSKLAEAIGRGIKMSPMKIDYLLRGYTGTMGGYAADLFDSILDLGSEAPKAAKRFEQMPILRRFLVDPEARGQVTAYYEMKNNVDEITRTSNFLQKTMDYKDWGEYMQDNIKMLATKQYILDMDKTMKQFREMKTMINASKMTADAKRDALQGILEAENKLTANIKTLKKQME